MKHTSGEWKVRTTVDNSGDYPYPTYDILAIHDYGPEGVACAYQNPHNARLMAASPDLLEALKELLSDWDCICRVHQWDDNHLHGARIARQAIAKAGGNTDHILTPGRW